MKRTLAVLAVLSLAIVAKAENIEVNSFRYAGPFAIQKPYELDTIAVDGSSFKLEKLLDSPVNFKLLNNAPVVSALPAADGDALNLLGFSFENNLFTKATLKVDGLTSKKIYLDGKEFGGAAMKLEPGTHDVVIKYLATAESKDSLSVSIETEKDGRIVLKDDASRIYSLDINSMGIACGGVSVSADGKYITVTKRLVKADGKSEYSTEIMQASDLKVIRRSEKSVYWMPTGHNYYYTEKTVNGKRLLVADPVTNEETVICENVPQDYFTVSPDLKHLFISEHQEGPVEGEVHQIIVPADRQPGWRDRSSIAMYNMETGVTQPLTFGFHNSYLCDINADGSKILFMSSRERLTQRPTTLMSIYLMDIATLETVCLVEDDGFVGTASFSPDGKKILIQGSPECLGGIGCTTGPEQTPSMIQSCLYVMDIATKEITPLTKDFNPNIEDARWSKYDNKIYAKVEDKDCLSLYRIDPANGKAENLNISEDYLSRYDIADEAPLLIYYGQSLENSDRVYTVDLKKKSQKLIKDFSAERLENVTMGQGGAYEFTSRNGDLINGFYVLPPNFDPEKKYPLIVHYYGGCSPTSRYCIGAYSPQVYAAQGYIFYVINPSGATGFGQEFAARHVNTAGDVVADDIIEGVQKFCEDHPYVNTEKIGCFSASYGGFMTQLLLCKTDMFATGISHAGISDHTSYWGEGYWGYSYSEVSMANSYPWTRKDLYVDRSPLYFADKCHTPLLFLHGSADVNVPIGESIQMFTALKLLGQETAFVVVDGEDHGVYDYAKRRQWLRTIFAWFSKYLQDDDTWWNELYPAKNL